MAARTYIPSLRAFAWVLKRFINRYQVKIQQGLNDETYAVLVSLLALLDELLFLLGDAHVDP